MIFPRLCLALTLAVLFAAQPAAAQRCGNYLINRGETRYDILGKCGEPDTKDRRTVYREYPNPYGLKDIAPIEIEEWTYNPGPNRFVFTVVFINGRVDTVERHSDYGR